MCTVTSCIICIRSLSMTSLLLRFSALDFDTSMNSDQEEDPLASLKENTIKTDSVNSMGEEANRVLASVEATINVIPETN